MDGCDANLKLRGMTMSEQPWEAVGEGTPLNAWLETKREGESGTNRCFCRVLCIGDEPEWIDHQGYSTLVNPGSFAPPTHWRWPREIPMNDPYNAKGWERAIVAMLWIVGTTFVSGMVMIFSKAISAN